MKKYFLTGLVLLMPLLLTLFLFIFLIDLFTAPFLGMVTTILSSFEDVVPILKSPEVLTVISRICVLILLCVFLVFLGFIARLFFFKAFMNWLHKILSHIPVVRTIYRVMRDVVTAFFGEEGRKAFIKPVLVPFPSEKSYCASFISGKVPVACSSKVKEKLVSVFVPTAPHPISGYMILVPEKKIKNIDMTMEDTVKFTVSCGVILPKKKSSQKKEKRREKDG